MKKQWLSCNKFLRDKKPFKEGELSQLLGYYRGKAIISYHCWLRNVVSFVVVHMGVVPRLYFQLNSL